MKITDEMVLAAIRTPIAQFIGTAGIVYFGVFSNKNSDYMENLYPTSALRQKIALAKAEAD